MHCTHRNGSAPPFTPAMLITDVGGARDRIARWLLDGEITRATVVPPRPTSLGRPARPAVRSARDGGAAPRRRRGVRQRAVRLRRPREVVGETGTVSLAAPCAVRRRASAAELFQHAHDWRDRFARAYALQLQAWISSVRAGAPAGASAWDGYAASAVADACLDFSLRSGQPMAVRSAAPRPLRLSGAARPRRSRSVSCARPTARQRAGSIKGIALNDAIATKNNVAPATTAANSTPPPARPAVRATLRRVTSICAISSRCTRSVAPMSTSPSTPTTSKVSSRPSRVVIATSSPAWTSSTRAAGVPTSTSGSWCRQPRKTRGRESRGLDEMGCGPTSQLPAGRPSLQPPKRRLPPNPGAARCPLRQFLSLASQSGSRAVRRPPARRERSAGRMSPAVCASGDQSA